MFNVCETDKKQHLIAVMKTLRSLINFLQFFNLIIVFINKVILNENLRIMKMNMRMKH